MTQSADRRSLEDILGQTTHPLSAEWLNANSTLSAENWESVLSKHGHDISYLTDEEEKPGKIFVVVRDADGYATGRWVDPNKPYDLAILNQDYEGALKLSEEALEKNPQDPDALFDKAYALALLGRPEEAAAHYDQVLALDPENSSALNNKALCLQQMGKHEEAFSYLERAHELDPQSLITKGNLAFSHLERGNMAEFERLMGEFLDAQPRRLEDRLVQEEYKQRTGLRSKADFMKRGQPSEADNDNALEI